MRLDDIGAWSEVKLDIIRGYADAYSAVMTKQTKAPLTHIYIDGFAGAGQHRSRTTGEIVAGSPLNVLNVQHPFAEYHFVDLNPAKTAHLAELVGERPNVRIYSGDCNVILPETVFPRARYEDFRRALCLLDPYGLHLDWPVTFTAGQMGTIDILLNFPMMDMNMNVLWNNVDAVDADQAARMTRFWGDETWREAAYTTDLPQPNLFDEPQKAGNEAVVKSFQKRLQEVAGFDFVPEPIPMKNSTNAVVYYLFFASNNSTGGRIGKKLLDKHRS
jgi:three-Cys-motif partner protein